MSERVRRPGVWFGVGVLIAIVLAAIAVASLTRSDWGRGQILRYTLETLGGRLTGSLVVERLDGDLFTGAKLYGLSILEPNGDPVLVADSAFIEYRVATFIGGDIVINRLVLFDPEMSLHRLPGDSLWNYQRVLQNPRAGPEGTGAGRATLIERLEVIDGTAVVRLAWEPERRIRGAAREQAIRAALADTSRLVVDSVPGGYARTMRFAVDSAALAQLTISPDERGGTALEIEAVRAEAYLWSGEPLAIEGLAGALTLREGVLRFALPRIVLPGSRAESTGLVDMTGEEPRYDLVVAGSGIDLADLQWLLPSLPDQGAISLRLWLETRPEGLLYLARELDVRAEDTRLVGEMGIIVGDTVRFVEADLRAEPLDLRTVRDLLPPTVPVDGLRLGALVVETPSS